MTLKIVGIFTANGSVAETEIWCDARVLQGAYRRGNSYQSVLARLDSPASFDTFKNWLTSNPQLDVQVRRESEYYAAQSTTMTSLIHGIGFTIAALMGIGAVFGAILTMYYGGGDAHARDRDAARARLQHRVGACLGAGRVARARRARRADRRRSRVRRRSTATRRRR